MLITIIKWVILSIGLTACLAGGIALVGITICLATNYAWRQMKAAHGLLKLHRVVVEHDSAVAEFIKRRNYHE